MVEAAAKLIGTGGLGGQPKERLAALLRAFVRWRVQLEKDDHVVTVAMMLDESGYIEMWQHDKSPEAPSRLENLKELVRALADFETLAGFLDHVSLVMANHEAVVSLMTLHSAKRLGFHTVFVPDWEEGLFPNQRTLDEVGLKCLEDERRPTRLRQLAKQHTESLHRRTAHCRYRANWFGSIGVRYAGAGRDAAHRSFLACVPANSHD